MAGPVVPAYCPNCGALFPSAFPSLFGFGRGTRVHLQGNVETCPHCGGVARTADGVFDIAGNVLTVVYAPGVTRTMLLAVSQAVKKAIEEKKKPEEVVKDVEKIDPRFGEAVRTGVNSGFPLLPLLILFLVAIKLSCSFEYKVDVNRLIEQLQHTPPAAVISAPDPPPLSTEPDVAQPP